MWWGEREGDVFGVEGNLCGVAIFIPH